MKTQKLLGVLYRLKSMAMAKEFHAKNYPSMNGFCSGSLMKSHCSEWPQPLYAGSNAEDRKKRNLPLNMLFNLFKKLCVWCLFLVVPILWCTCRSYRTTFLCLSLLISLCWRHWTWLWGLYSLDYLTCPALSFDLSSFLFIIHALYPEHSFTSLHSSKHPIPSSQSYPPTHLCLPSA